MSEIKKKKQNPKLPFPVHSHLTYEFEHYFELAFNTRTALRSENGVEVTGSPSELRWPLVCVGVVVGPSLPIFMILW